MGWRVIAQLIAIAFIVVGGESYVSSKGYYQYTRQINNGPFIGNVPLWIPFLWIFSIQAGFLIGFFMGLDGLGACIYSGLFAVVFDLVFLEPYFSRKKEYWVWKPVENGYFGFIPPKVNRFTAPPGNYIVWWIFPMFLNYIVFLLSVHFP